MSHFDERISSCVCGEHVVSLIVIISAAVSSAQGNISLRSYRCVYVSAAHSASPEKCDYYLPLAERPPNTSPYLARCQSCYTSTLRRSESVGLRRTLTSHWKGFSPVCVRMCSSRPRFWLKALLHSVHLYGFSCKDTHWTVTLNNSCCHSSPVCSHMA